MAQMCPAVDGTAAGTVSIGAASTSGDDTFDSPACNPENIYRPDGKFVGIAYEQQQSMPKWDGVKVSACLEVGFGAVINADGMHVVGAATDELACGVSCCCGYCGTDGTLEIFTSEADTDTMPDYTMFSHAGRIALLGNTKEAPYDATYSFDARRVKWAVFCRGAAGAARDHLVLDFVELKPVDGDTCKGTTETMEHTSAVDVPKKSMEAPEIDGTPESDGTTETMEHTWVNAALSFLSSVFSQAVALITY